MRGMSLIVAMLAPWLGLMPAGAGADPVPLASEGPVQPARFDGIRYRDEDGAPTYRVTDDGKRVDWASMVGYLRYNANCIACHGPDGAGSTYAPSLVDALKHDDYAAFVAIVRHGKANVNAAEDLVMPAFADDRNVTCYLDDIYVYLRGRSDGVIGRGRPAEHEPRTPAYGRQEDACMG